MGRRNRKTCWFFRRHAIDRQVSSPDAPATIVTDLACAKCAGFVVCASLNAGIPASSKWWAFAEFAAGTIRISDTKPRSASVASVLKAGSCSAEAGLRILVR